MKYKQKYLQYTRQGHSMLEYIEKSRRKNKNIKKKKVTK